MRPASFPAGRRIWLPYSQPGDSLNSYDSPLPTNLTHTQARRQQQKSAGRNWLAREARPRFASQMRVERIDFTDAETMLACHQVHQAGHDADEPEGAGQPS